MLPSSVLPPPPPTTLLARLRASLAHAVARLRDTLVHGDTAFLESCVVFAMAIRAHYLLTNHGLVREAYPLFTRYVAPWGWLLLLTLSAALITYGLASPIPPTITRRRFRAAGLALASLYYGGFSLALALGPGPTGEASLTWALGSFSMLAAARLAGFVAGERDWYRIYDAPPGTDGAEIQRPTDPSCPQGVAV